MRNRALKLVLAITVAPLLAGCGGENLLGNVSFEESEFGITVTNGVSPDYDWEGAAAQRLTVRRVSDGATIWDLVAEDPDVGFGGPVAHGATPAGATAQNTAEFLDGGVTYQVVITRVDLAVGRQQFTPSDA